MPLPAIVTLAITAVLVAALAFYLIAVWFILRHVRDTLGKVTFGVRAIAHRAEPLDGTLGAMNADLEAVAGALEELAGQLEAAETRATSDIR
jgi:hypothetical protein